MKNLTRSLTVLLVPLVLMALGGIILLNAEKMSENTVMFFKYISYVLFIIVMCISWWSNRGRIFFTALVLVISQLALVEFVPKAISYYAYTEQMYSVIGIFVPINILVFTLMKECGVLTPQGKFCIGLIICELIGIYRIFVIQDLTIFEALGSKTVFSIVFLIVFFAMLLKQYLKGLFSDTMLTGVLIAVLFAVKIKSNIMAVPIFFTVSAAILLICTIQALYFMAYKDELTKLPSRRALREDMMKLGGRYAIAMLDIDFFKKCNDTYGHDAGDGVLKMVAYCIKHVTGGGKGFRYGGEEFTILFPNKDIKEVIPHLEDLRETISKKVYKYVGKGKSKSGKKRCRRISVTISIGVSQRNDRYRTPEEVLKGSDKALYRAKKKGRNRVSR